MARQFALAVAMARSDPQFVRGLLGTAGLVFVIILIAALTQGAAEGLPA